MSQENLSEKIESFYRSLEVSTGLSKEEIEFRALSYLKWSMEKAHERYMIYAMRKNKDNGVTLRRPNLDILEKIYQQ